MDSLGSSDSRNCTSDVYDTKTAMFLDSGMTYLVLPESMYEAVISVAPGLGTLDAEGLYKIDCDVGDRVGSMDFQFGSTRIRVPYGDLVLKMHATYCTFLVMRWKGERKKGTKLHYRNSYA